jgi:hypothetical protein
VCETWKCFTLFIWYKQFHVKCEFVFEFYVIWVLNSTWLREGNPPFSPPSFGWIYCKWLNSSSANYRFTDGGFPSIYVDWQICPHSPIRCTAFSDSDLWRVGRKDQFVNFYCFVVVFIHVLDIYVYCKHSATTYKLLVYNTIYSYIWTKFSYYGGRVDIVIVLYCILFVVFYIPYTCYCLRYYYFFAQTANVWIDWNVCIYAPRESYNYLGIAPLPVPGSWK